MKTYMFPGQGSQKVGMGGELFDHFSELTAKADEILGYSVKTLCLEDPQEQLGQTQFTQPALYVVNALSYYKLLEDTGEKPDFVAGHSLGEFNALLAAGCFSFEDGLKLVKKRGELMSQVSGGGMAAITNANIDQIKAVLNDNDLNNIGLANFNTPQQTVISGLREDIDNAKAFFEQAGLKFTTLATSGAFHSHHMAPSQQEFAGYLDTFELAPLQIPVIANVTALPYEDTEVLTNLSKQIASSVMWSNTVVYLMEEAEKAGEQMEFVEVGHGKVLAGLARRIKRELAKTK